MDGQHAAWCRASQDETEMGPMGWDGDGTPRSGVTPAALKARFAPLARDLDADFEPRVCRRVCAGLPVLARESTKSCPKRGHQELPQERAPRAAPREGTKSCPRGGPAVGREGRLAAEPADR